ncbi:unnamed protein product [Cylicocyclus nassatus]|uniref:Uncharacterized protein n=1 Tax=Cylicocyclus nassatus TaxID=53992 RepID=A0AA36GGP8_CYLNA|nr:unnamed protein product [Cylicocyclus nassatus]
MHRAVIICCIFASFALVGAEKDFAQGSIYEKIEETNQDSEESKPDVGSEVAMMDSGSSEDAPDSFVGEDGAVIRAKRYCGYGKHTKTNQGPELI